VHLPIVLCAESRDKGDKPEDLTRPWMREMMRKGEKRADGGNLEGYILRHLGMFVGLMGVSVSVSLFPSPSLCHLVESA
jgi:hypothetical protein